MIYELVNETINKEAFSVAFPDGWKARIRYFLLIPLTHLQYMLIPSPLSKRNDNYYPLTLFMSIIFIAKYAIVITWLTYAMSVACLNSNFSILPMLVYPFGVSVRDVKKFRDFELAL